MSLEGFIGSGNGNDNPYINSVSAGAMGLPTGSWTTFNPPALSLTLKSNKMEGQSEMPLNFDPSLLGRIREEGHESRSGSDNLEGASGDEVDAANTAAATGGRQSKRKKYHRHTPFQIQELESYFKLNNHPDEKERLELGRRLSLESKQVKFWFQNRRTQMKTQSERQENNYLKRQNEELLIDNIRMKEAMRNPICNNCGGPAILGDVSIEEHHLRVENARLKDELNRISLLANKFLGRPLSSLVGNFNSQMQNPGLELGVGRNGFNGMNSAEAIFPIGFDTKEGILNNMPMIPATNLGPPINGVDLQFEKSFLLELALRAMDELVKLAQSDDPMWVRSVEGERESLNHDEYIRTCPPCIGMKPNGFVTEATKATGMVMMNSLGLVELFMDSTQWADMFPCLIGKTSIIDVLFSGIAGSRNSSLQLMQAEFQALSSLVPVRHMKFLRFCKQHGEGLWAIVDVSIDSIREGSDAPTFVNYRRLPSGCIIQDMPNGYSKVTWVEHTEYDENIVNHLYRPLLISGLGFGAQRWLAALQRQCDCITTLSSTSLDDNSGFTVAGKRSMVKLAHRMTRDYCSAVCATIYMWKLVEIGNASPDMRLLIRNNNINNNNNNNSSSESEPPGLVLSATTSVWIPLAHQSVFNFLRNEQMRSEWDELSSGQPMQEMVQIFKGQDRASCVSLLQATAANVNQNATLILQETQTDESGSIIVYTPVNLNSMQMVLHGGDSANVPLSPSGFAIAPDGFPENGNLISGKSGGGSLLTVCFQIPVNNLPSAKLTMESVGTINDLISRLIQRIKTALHCNQQVD